MKSEIKLSKLQSQGIFVDSKDDKETIVSRKSYTMFNNSIGSEEYTFAATIAKDEIDRDGEVVIVDGIDYTEYQKNPLLCWQHNYSAFPLGKCIGLERVSGELRGKFWTANTPLGKEAGELVKSGCLKGVSIGFIRKSIARRGTIEFNNALRQYSIKDTPALKQITLKAELCEVSLVNIQSNRSGLINEVVSKGYKAFEAALGIKETETEIVKEDVVIQNVQETEKINTKVEQVTLENVDKLFPVVIVTPEPIKATEEPKPETVVEKALDEVIEAAKTVDKIADKVEEISEKVIAYCTVLRNGPKVISKKDIENALIIKKGKLLFK